MSKQNKNDIAAMLQKFKQHRSRSLPSCNSEALSHTPKRIVVVNSISEEDELKRKKKHGKIFPPIKSVDRIVSRTRKLNMVEQHIISNYLHARVAVKYARKKVKLFSQPMQTIQTIQTNAIEMPQEYRSMGMQSNRQSFDPSEANVYSLKEEPRKRQLPPTTQINLVKVSEWVQVNPFTLETQFVLLRKAVESTSSSPQVESLLKNKQYLICVPEQHQISRFIKEYVPGNTDLNILEMIKKPQFEVQYEGDQLYFGMIEDGERHGPGVLIRKNYVFEGEWKYGTKLKGLERNDVGVYRGAYLNDKKEGQGQFQWINGEFYSGEWHNGKKHGAGLWRSLKGDCYVGEWQKGSVDGQGVHTTANKQKYEGEFRDFLKHGWGREMFANGDVYEGHYQQGKPSGKGVYKWKNRITYEGEFEDGYRQGKGSLKTPEGVQYLGQFKQERAEGLCEISYPNGDTYRGEFRNGMKNGSGLLSLASERMIYNGWWRDDEFLEKVIKK